jgi:two-component system, NarL family, response regulator
MSQPITIQVLIVEDHAIVRRGLATIINRDPEMTVIAQAEDGQQAIAVFRDCQPDVTLMDLRMPKMAGVEAIAAMCGEFKQARITVLTTYNGDEDIYCGLQAGAQGYLLKDAKSNELLNAIRTIHGGQKYVPPAVGVKLLQRMSNPDREGQFITFIDCSKSHLILFLSLWKRRQQNEPIALNNMGFDG